MIEKYRTERLNHLLDEVVDTPSNMNKFSLNPGYEQAPRNPLCPVCEEEIHPISNNHERRFVCGCEITWQFTFDCLVDTETNGG